MKRILTLCLALSIATFSFAQEPLYLLFEFMEVNDEHMEDYLEVETFWSKIHQQRIADGSIDGWDLWELMPSGSEQGSQYLTVTVYHSLEQMMTPMNMDAIRGYAKKAHSISDKELNAIMDKTVVSRNIANQLYLKQLSSTINAPEMHEGIYATLDFMKELDENYERMEERIFRIWHQQSVDQEEMNSWELLRIIMPFGSDVYATHVTVGMYEDLKQLTTYLEQPEDNTDYMNMMAAAGGIQTRDLKHRKIARLIMMIR